MNQSQPVNTQVLLTAGLMFPAFLEMLFAPLSDVSWRKKNFEIGVIF